MNTHLLDGAADPDAALFKLDNAPATAPRSELHQAALDYIAKGRRVIPIVPGGKTPMIKAWQANAFTTAEQVDAHWTVNPDSNIAFEPETEGLCVVEQDPGGDVGPLNLPATYQVQSPRGGIHYYFTGSLPASASKLAESIDTRGRGSYVLVPPSTVNGKRYRVVNDIQPAPLPPAITAKLAPKAASAKAPDGVEIDSPSNIGRARGRVRDLIARGDVAIQGKGGDNRTYQLACELVRDLGLSPDAAFPVMLEWNRQCQPPWESEELRAKLERAVSYGQNEPGAYASAPASEVFANTRVANILVASEVKPGTRAKSRFAPVDLVAIQNRPRPTFWDGAKLFIKAPEGSLVILSGPKAPIRPA